MAGPRRISRRAMLKHSALGLGTAVAAPYLVPASARGADGAVAPGERLVMAGIGIGGQGRHDMINFMTHKDVQFVAVCDVDAQRLEVARKIVNEGYGNGDCAVYRDFRELLARDDIDAVLIATPDHWHALLAIAAAEAGKDVYCEKPISVTIAEGRAVAEAVERYGIVYQSGTQRRCIPAFAYPVEVARSGRLGRIHTVHTCLGAGPACGIEPPQPVPEGFDYDRWLGPAPAEPYTPRRCHGSFRWIFDYSGGKLTDIGAHFNDLAQWGIDMENTGPVEYDGSATFPEEGLWDTPMYYSVVCRYANGIRLVMHDVEPRSVRFEGEHGWISVDDSGLVLADPPSLLEGASFKQEQYDVMYGHQRNFLDCVRTRARPIANAEVAHRSSTVCHAANLCLRLGRKLYWDPVQEQFLNDDEANRMRSRAMRAPWHL
ncbi:MAG: Gfo/Idh/MocA family oxidoreductase [Candidatus Hydrogenedentes bacterium]|nr:Gfo/Idh/MocA family oxidoreductase [Candidatus Hydrogenedentota bacterium]